jgi:type IV secretory pathway TrbF-like protein
MLQPREDITMRERERGKKKNMATNSYQKLICMYETSWHECSFSKGNLQQAKKIVILFIIHKELAPVAKKTARNEPLLLHVGFSKGNSVC